MFYGIKGWVFADEGNLKQKISNPPFEAITGFDKLEELMALLKKNEKAPIISGYLVLLVPQDQWKGED